MNIVLLVFGNKSKFHVQTCFAILTVLGHKRPTDSITVYTDRPEYYNRLAGSIVIEPLGQDILKQWMDGKDYIYRIKIKAIADCAAKNPDRHLLFLDGDTFLRGGLDAMEGILDAGAGMMYTDEGHPSGMRGASLKMWNSVKGHCIEGVRISEKHNVWNSGVIAIPGKHVAAVTSLALKVCDDILESGSGCFTAEQYAFSIAMQETLRLQPATEWVGHYWGNKEQWNDMAQDFFTVSYMTGRSTDEDIAAIDWQYLETLPLHVKKSNTQRRIIKLVRKLFPDRA